MSTHVDGNHADEERPGSQSSLRNANETRILEALRFGGQLTQAELARRTALAPSTVSNIVRELAEAGALEVDEEHGGRRGRMVRLAADGRLLLAVDFGHGHVSVALATTDREIVGETHAPLPLGHDHQAGLAKAVSLRDLLLQRAGLDAAAVVAVGMSLPAPIDNDGRIVGSRLVLPGWADIDLAVVAQERLGVPVHVDNDANAGAVAEHLWGAGRGADDLVYLKLAHGVGAGLIMRGKPFRGATGVAGEIGHTTIDERGVFCRCGNRGCLETVAASPRLLALLANTHPRLRTIDDLVQAARTGDPACLRELNDTGRAVGVAAANMVNVLNPAKILIGGELALAGDLLLDPMREIVRRYGVPSAVSGLVIEAAELGARASLLGDVVLASELIEPWAGVRG